MVTVGFGAFGWAEGPVQAVRSVPVRTPLALYVVALVVRAAVMVTFPDPAYPDSYYYADVARAISAGHGLNVDFIWIFAEVGNHLPNPAVLPVPSNAHWLPLASFIVPKSWPRTRPGDHSMPRTCPSEPFNVSSLSPVACAISGVTARDLTSPRS